MCEITQAMEIADKNLSELKSEEIKPSINLLKSCLGKVKTLVKDSSEVKEIATTMEDCILHLVGILRQKNAENLVK